MTIPMQTDATATAVWLPVASLSANDYNPNEMTKEQMAELVAEIRHLGRLPKPVIVRPNGRGYVIVDGEHGWRAAQTVGLTDVPCEVVDVDDFEARRQTYKRNQHGTHNPVRLGQMFQQMMADRSLSQRALATEMEVSEGTVRNALVYTEAATLRNGYASRKTVAIEQLSVRQVRAYVALPPAIGNLWLDCGASLAAVYGCKTDRDVELYGLEQQGSEGKEWFAGLYARLEQAALVPYLKGLPLSPEGFRKAIKQLHAWDHWEARWCILGLTRDDLRPYTRHHFSGAWTVRDRDSMDRALDLIIDTTGCTTPGRYIEGTKPRFHLTPDEFDTVVLHTTSIAESQEHLRALVTAKTGVEPDHNNRRKLQQMELTIAKPAYLEGSTLPIEQQHALWRARGWTDREFLVERGPSISLDEAKRELAQRSRVTCEGQESVEEAIARHLRRYYDRALMKLKVKTLTAAEMVEAITRRMPIYDTENPRDCEAMAVMAATLMHLTRPELLCLFEYSEYLDQIKALGILGEALATGV